MVQSEMLEKLNAEPFITLRLQRSNGTSFDIANPDTVWVSKHSVFIAHPLKRLSRGIGSYDLVSLVHIVRLQKLEDSATAGAA